MANVDTSTNIRKIGGKADSGGIQLGDSSSSKVGFFGTTPIAQPTLTLISTATATTTLNELAISRIIAALAALGLVVTA